MSDLMSSQVPKLVHRNDSKKNKRTTEDIQTELQQIELRHLKLLKELEKAEKEELNKNKHIQRVHGVFEMLLDYAIKAGGTGKRNPYTYQWVFMIKAGRADIHQIGPGAFNFYGIVYFNDETTARKAAKAVWNTYFTKE